MQNVNQMRKLIYSIQEQNLHVVYPIEFLGDNYECRNNRSLSPLASQTLSELDPNKRLFRV